MTKKQSSSQSKRRNSGGVAGPLFADSDHVDLSWYFGWGKNPDLRGHSAEVRKRWSRIHRLVDGRCVWTCRYFAAGRDLTAVSDDHSTAVRLLQDEYRQYLARKRIGPSGAEPFLLVEGAEVSRLLLRNRPQTTIKTRRDKIRTLEMVVRGPAYLDVVDNDAVDAERQGPEDFERGTWGLRRLDVEDARFFLEREGLGYADARRISGKDAIEKLKALLAKTPEWAPRGKIGRPAQRETRAETLERRADEREAIPAVRAKGHKMEMFGIFGLNNQALAPDTWHPGHIERNSGNPNVTVTELARKLKLDAKWVRQQLLKHGFGGAALKRIGVPIASLGTEAGRAFWSSAVEKALLDSKRSAHGPVRRISSDNVLLSKNILDCSGAAKRPTKSTRKRSEG